MADRYEAELLLVQVLAPEGADEEERRAREAAPELSRLANELAGPRGRARVAVESEPARSICRIAEEENVDVVVVGSVDMRERREFLLANVPNRVSHNARCTVVIVNTTDPERHGVGRLFRGRK
jgi:nucleotide-binding universal stress UspA family protein